MPEESVAFAPAWPEVEWVQGSGLASPGWLGSQREARLMLGAGIEPAWDLIPRDFKSLASTGFATRAEKDEPARLADTDPEKK